LGNALGIEYLGAGNKEGGELCGADYFCSLKFRKGKVFLVAGMKESENHKDSLHDINYELCLCTARQRASWRQKVDDSTSAFLFTLSFLTFQKERLYEPANKWTQFWVCIAVLFLAGQTALVLFAIRRRFKR
jgi:hypothetical protein